MPENEFSWRPRRVIVGYDRSRGADDAVALCAAVAAPDAHVALVDVLPYPGAPSETFRLLTSSEFPIPDDFFGPAIARLPGRQVEVLTYIGASPARIFESLATDDHFDLIVVGSPHRGTIGRILAGSVSESLLHGSPVPVLTAPHGYAASPPALATGQGTIAVGYDGGAESQAALAYAQAIATQTGATLDVLTVQRPIDPVGGAIAYTMSLPQNVDDIQRQALHEVDPTVDLRRRLLNGPAAEAIADACADGVDLLVVGSRGYGTAERVLLGSTSRALIREASCPVLVVPRPRAADKAGVETATAATDAHRRAR
jgi:nucleotide-binding universal stress UspA family protein